LPLKSNENLVFSIRYEALIEAKEMLMLQNQFHFRKLKMGFYWLDLQFKNLL